MARNCRVHAAAAAAAAPERVRGSEARQTLVLPRPEQQEHRSHRAVPRQLHMHPQLQRQQQQPQQQGWQQADLQRVLLRQQVQQQQQLQAQLQHAAVLQLVAQCRTWQAVGQLLQQHHQQLSPAHTEALLQRLVAVAPPLRVLSSQQRQQMSVLVGSLAALLLQQLPATTSAQLFTCVRLLTALGHRPSQQWATAVLARLQQQLNNCSVAELTTFIGAAAAWREALQPSAAAAPVSASAALGASPTTPAAPAAATSSAVTVNDGPSTSLPCWPSSSTSSISMPALLTRFLSVSERQLTSRGTRVTGQQLEVLARSLAALGARPSHSWLYVYVRQLGSVMPEVPARPLVAIACVLADWGCRLPEHVARQLERAMGASVGMLRPNELVSALDALTRLRHRPANGWIDAVFGRALLFSSHLDARAVVGLVAAAAGLQYELPPEWLDLLLMQARHALQGLSGSEVIGLIDAVSAHHHKPGPGFMAAYMEQAGRHVQQLSLGDLAALIAGLAEVACRPPPQWMAAFVRALLARAPSPRDYGVFMKLLGALRKLQYTPPGDVMARMEAQVDQLALGLPYHQIQELRGALAGLQYEAIAASAGAAATVHATAAAAADAASSAGEEGVQELGVELHQASYGSDRPESEHMQQREDCVDEQYEGSETEEEWEEGSMEDSDVAMLALEMLS